MLGLRSGQPSSLPNSCPVATKETASVQEVVLNFGRHKGKSIKHVNDEYLRWMQTAIETSWWREVATKVLEQREQQRGAATRNRKKVLLDELKVCRNLKRGKQLHAEVIESGDVSCIYVATALINMYAKCGNMVEARRVFDGIKFPDVVSWTALILRYAEHGQGRIALDMFARMKSQGFTPNSLTFVAALKACSAKALEKDGMARKGECLELGRQIHREIGCCLNIYVQNSLIDMYVKCGSIVEARQVFDGIKHPDVVSWTAIISGYVDNGEGGTALLLFARMKAQGCAPNPFTYVAVLKACASLAVKQSASGRAQCLERGKQIHSEIYHSDIYVQSTLIDMYAKCGSMVDAQKVFDGIRFPNVVAWTSLILGYAENGEGETALKLFEMMKSRGCPLNPLAFVAAVKACTSAALKQDEKGRAECLELGRRIHSQIGCHLDVSLQNTLIDMYSKCGSMVHAQEVFDEIKQQSVVSWNALILGYAENGEGLRALNLFASMKSRGFVPDSFTFVAALKACTSTAMTRDGSGKVECLEWGKQIHSEIACHLDVYIQSTLIDMYANCRSMADARKVFDVIKRPDVVSWTALIMGYAENGDGATALNLFEAMRSQGCAPNSFTFVAALKACSLLCALEVGKELHAEIECGTEFFNTVLVTSLVDFYTKCGCLVEAQEVFDSHPRTRSMITWNALLAGYGRFGDSKTVFELFDGMQRAGFKPDGITFLCMLKCCSHVGLVEKATEIFEMMSKSYGITPTVEHYTCMLDVLGRSNKLDDAMALLQSMPCKADAVTWMTVLAACRKWKNVEIGRVAFESLLALDDTDAPAYVLMGHIYGSRGMWEEQKSVGAMRKKFKAWKEPGRSSWTNGAGEVHTFLVEDNKHPQIQEIQEKLTSMFVAMKKHGYVADLSSISSNATDAEKEEALCGHSEKLALACALINTEPGKTIRIVKNLRVCDDCHAATALVSKLESRTIICRDASRFHVFNEGQCSCGDFW